jgi:predicted dehydrogenase
MAPLTMRAAPRTWRVAIVGHTGRGNYGHGLDIAFRGVENAEVVAVADPVEDGRAKALARAGAPRGYADYREMLEREKPDIAVIGPRWLDQRVAMVRAATAQGAHLLMEKAFAATLEDADAMMQAIGDRKVQVCHTARPVAATLEAIRLIREGAIGEVLELRARGKEDHRAGGEDMLTLGTHCFDLMRMIAGNPVRCTARVEGPRKTPGEVIGPVAGDEIAATFEFASGVPSYFASRKNSGPSSQRYGVTVFGSKGAIDFPLNDIPNETWILRSPNWRGEWQKIAVESGPYANAPRAASHPEVNTLLARDLIAAIEQDREPMCSARDGLWTIEMVQAVYASSQAGAPVGLPLRTRRHPLA